MSEFLMLAEPRRGTSWRTCCCGTVTVELGKFLVRLGFFVATLTAKPEKDRSEGESERYTDGAANNKAEIAVTTR